MTGSAFRIATRCLLAYSILASTQTTTRGQGASIQSVSQRVFVTSVTPVVGPRGVVGGVSVNADGVVSRATAAATGRLDAKRQDALAPNIAEIDRPSPMRMISLKQLDARLAEFAQRREIPPPEMLLLAGLQRVEYLFVVPDQNDLLLAGPADGWRVDQNGEVVGRSTGLPVVCLSDLMQALRSSRAARTEGISCSIEPTQAGLKRYAQLINTRKLAFNPQSVRAIEQAMGTQQVIVSGVNPDGHYARVMVGADYVMKRLAMGIEPSPIDDLPSYLQLLQRQRAQPVISSPRWWMTVDYEPLLHSPDLMAWHLRGQGLKTLTEDSLLDEQGRRTTSNRRNPSAEQWAETMTARMGELSAVFPVFGHLRNCVDLSVIAALIAKRDLMTSSGCQLEVLLDATRIRSESYEVPKSVDSQVSFVRGRNGWIVSVSGGVEVDSWSAVKATIVDESLTNKRDRAVAKQADRWWWDE